MELSQFAQEFTPVFVFCLDTTENDWNLVLNDSWFGTGWGSEEPVFCRVGSVGEPVALRFLRLRVTSVNSSSWLTDVIMVFK